MKLHHKTSPIKTLYTGSAPRWTAAVRGQGQTPCAVFGAPAPYSELMRRFRSFCAVFGADAPSWPEPPKKRFSS